MIRTFFSIQSAAEKEVYNRQYVSIHVFRMSKPPNVAREIFRNTFRTVAPWPVKPGLRALVLDNEPVLVLTETRPWHAFGAT
jgi:hypothetical protein